MKRNKCVNIVNKLTVLSNTFTAYVNYYSYNKNTTKTLRESYSEVAFFNLGRHKPLSEHQQ